MAEPGEIERKRAAVVARADVLRGQLKQRFDVEEYHELQALEALGSWVTSPPGPVTVTGIEPESAVVGGPDVTLRVYGTGFTAETVILFNFGEEPTTYVSGTEVTTGLKPSTASGAWTVPVSVVGAAESIDFSFTMA